MKNQYKKIFILTGILLVMANLLLVGQTTIKAGATLVQVYSSNLYYEGPTWDPVTGKLYFTTPNDSPYNVYRLEAPGQVSVWLANSQRVNGTFLTQEGRLLTAEQAAQRICSYRIGASGPEDLKVLASNTSWYYPNDLCVRKQSGDIYFTSVNWENKATGVYRIAPSGAVTKVISDMVQPNGIETAIDGTKLYVSDSGNRNWKVYAINSDATIGTGSVFFNPSSTNTNVPDGMTIDERGNLYFTGKGGIWIVSPAGAQLDFVTVPETCSNVTFGGTSGMTLYITCQNKVYSLETTVHGAYWTGTVTPTPTQAPTPTPTNAVLKGDVDGSGKVDILDALRLAQCAAGLTSCSNYSTQVADVNCSGTIDINDALLVARFSAGLITAFPCQ